MAELIYLLVVYYVWIAVTRSDAYNIHSNTTNVVICEQPQCADYRIVSIYCEIARQQGVIMIQHRYNKKITAWLCHYWIQEGAKNKSVPAKI